MKNEFNTMRENRSELKMIGIQIEMLKNLDTENHVCKEKLIVVAGVDLAYWKQNNVEMATCCIVLVDYNSHEIIEKVEYTDKVKCPYIPGCLAFRELPLFFRANEKLRNKPDLYVFDGNGYLHPRKMGIATHAGILLNIPTIGVAKSYYKIDDIDFVMPKNEVFAHTDIIIRGEVYGRVLRTHKNVKPVFVSCGNMIDLATATEVIKNLIVKESHIPLPTWKADIETHKVRKCRMENFTGI